MKITKMTLGRTLNVGNYESIRFELTAELDPKETQEHALKQLQKEVDAQETKLRREYRAK